jgi:hypothetical protein
VTAADEPLPPIAAIRWDKTFRLIPSRYPPIDQFERIADPEDWEVLAHIEGLTNDRLREEIGDIAVVPLGERITGPGASPIMAAFTHLGYGSRFTDGSFGVYYASDCFDGALAEVLHHRSLFLLRTAEPKTHFDLRTYIGHIDGKLHDIRGGWPEAHDPDTYVKSQSLGKRLLSVAGSYGIVYDSVRRSGAANIAVFRPKVLTAKRGKPHVIQGSHLRVEWDGVSMSRYIVIGEPSWRALKRNQPVIPRSEGGARGSGGPTGTGMAFSAAKLPETGKLLRRC